MQNTAPNMLAVNSTVFHEKNISAGLRCAGLILMYHRIGVAQCDPWGLAVSPERFEQHLQRLRKFGEPTPLRRIAASLEHDECSRGAVAVTFDDGYADNLHTAAPLLVRYDVPATVFVTTGYIGAHREFWWDELERILLTPAELPEELLLVLDGQVSGLSLGEARLYADDDRRADSAWFGHKQGLPSRRFAFFRTVHGRLMSASESDRRAALDHISLWTGDGGRPRASRLCVSRDEAVALGKQEAIELGAHTVTHAALSGLPAAAQKQEMRQSRLDLEALTGSAVRTFAYPFGLHSDETVELARQEGFVCACSTRPGAVAQRADGFSLPRIKVGDWDGEAFEKALAEWLPPSQ